jgi:hypothetical protein
MCQDVGGGVEKPIGRVPSDVFAQYAGEDHVVDARDLRDLISALSKQGGG